jgi:general secretion pathway protein K
MTDRHLRGAAVVLAMLLAAFAAAVAATVFADQQRGAGTVSTAATSAGAGAGHGGGAVDPQILDDDARAPIDHLGEPWAITLPPIPLDDGEIRGAIVDAQGRLNINALGAADASSEQERARLTQLFAQRGLPSAALAAIADWIDADGTASASGAEDAFYLAQPVPRLAANVPALRVAELAVVKGVDPANAGASRLTFRASPRGRPSIRNTAPRGARRHRRNAGRETSRHCLADRAASRSPRSPSSGRDCPTARRSRATSRCRCAAITST